MALAAQADTGAAVAKTDGISNSMLRTAGTVTRLAEGMGSSVLDEVAYEQGRLVSIVTSDVIDMVQQQGGAANGIDCGFGNRARYRHVDEELRALQQFVHGLLRGKEKEKKCG